MAHASETIEAALLAAVDQHLPRIAPGASPQVARRLVTHATISVLGKLLLVEVQSSEGARRPLLQMIDHLRLLVQATPPTEQ
jgi:hypothetical protein